MECHEFQDLLLLLCEDLQDKDIPHCMKVCKTVITAWKSWFTILKCEFAVGLTNQFWSSVVMSLFFRMQLQVRSGQIRFSAAVAQRLPNRGL